MDRVYQHAAAFTFEHLLFELRNPKTFGQPIIIEDFCYSAKDHYHVYVIWDEWVRYPSNVSVKLIMDAFYAVDPKKAQFFLQCTGLTMAEAWKQGFLPFGVEPRPYREGDPSLEEYIRVLIETDASEIPEFDLPQLRFHTLEEAEAAYEYLQQDLPNSRWLITVMSNKF